MSDLEITELPILNNSPISGALMIFKETAQGFKYQESRGGFELDDIIRAFGERVKKVVQ